MLLYEATTINFDEIIDVASKTYKLLVCLFDNLMFLAKADEDVAIQEVRFPIDDRLDLFCTIGFPIDIKHNEMFKPKGESENAQAKN